MKGKLKMIKFARIDCGNECVAYFAGTSLDTIREDLQNFPKNYDLSTLTEVDSEEIKQLCKNGWGGNGAERGYYRTLCAVLSIDRGIKSFCIDHLTKK